MVIKTAKDKEYNVNWCAVSSIDGCLRFETADVSFTDAFCVFNDKEETAKLVYIIDDVYLIDYYGFTKLVGINGSINITVTLEKEQNG